MGSHVNGSDIQSILKILVLAEALQAEKANNSQSVAILVKINCCLFQDGKFNLLLSLVALLEEYCHFGGSALD